MRPLSELFSLFQEETETALRQEGLEEATAAAAAVSETAREIAAGLASRPLRMTVFDGIAERPWRLEGGEEIP